MYKCEDCECLFEDDEIIKGHARVGEYWGVPAYVPTSSCPNCRSDRFVEIEPCMVCGSYDHKYYYDYCEECAKQVTEELKCILKDNFKEEEINLIKEIFEGEWYND